MSFLVEGFSNDFFQPDFAGAANDRSWPTVAAKVLRALDQTRRETTPESSRSATVDLNGNGIREGHP